MYLVGIEFLLWEDIFPDDFFLKGTKVLRLSVMIKFENSFRNKFGKKRKKGCLWVHSVITNTET